MRVLASIAVTFPFRRAKRGRFSCGVASGAVWSGQHHCQRQVQTRRNL